MGMVEKTEFRNRSGGHLGVVVLDRDGKAKGANVPPDGTIFLSDDEIQLTANAPQRAEDSPFIERDHQIRSPETGDVVEEGRWAALQIIREKRPVPVSATSGEQRPVPDTRSETGAPAAPQGDPPQGSYQPGEEVGTPGLGGA